MAFYRCMGGVAPSPTTYSVKTTSASGSAAKIAFYEGDTLLGEFVHSASGTEKKVGPFYVKYASCNWVIRYAGSPVIHNDDGLDVPISWSYGTVVNYTFTRYPSLE